MLVVVVVVAQLLLGQVALVVGVMVELILEH
jgi:hypothetical protein